MSYERDLTHGVVQIQKEVYYIPTNVEEIEYKVKHIDCSQSSDTSKNIPDDFD